MCGKVEISTRVEGVGGAFLMTFNTGPRYRECPSRNALLFAIYRGTSLVRKCPPPRTLQKDYA